MSTLWTPLVKRLHPYVPGEQPLDNTLVKLNTNENPFGPSPRVKEAIKAAVEDDLRLYPDPLAKSLREAIASHYGISPDNVFAGNGSDEVIALSFQAFFTGGGSLSFPDISYSFYPVYCALYGIEFELLPVADDLTLPLGAFPVNNAGIIFPNPNAPTSLAVSLDDIATLLDCNQHSVVVVDEAYVDFGGESAVALIDRYPNLLVTQTFSKSRSLAGMRVGFAMGHPELIEALYRVKDSFNSYPVDRLALVAAQAAIEDKQWFEDTRAEIIRVRDQTAGALRRAGYEVLDSKTNFLFVRHSGQNGEALYEKCRQAGILVRHWSKPRISDYIRITVGTEGDMQQLISALEV